MGAASAKCCSVASSHVHPTAVMITRDNNTRRAVTQDKGASGTSYAVTDISAWLFLLLFWQISVVADAAAAAVSTRLLVTLLFIGCAAVKL